MKAILATLSRKLDTLPLNQSLNHRPNVANEMCALCSNPYHTIKNYPLIQPIKRLILSRYMPCNHMRKPSIVLIHPHIILIEGITLIYLGSKINLCQTKENKNLVCSINNLSLLTQYIPLPNNLCLNLLYTNKENIL